MMIHLHSLREASCKLSWTMGDIYGRAKHSATTVDRVPPKESLGAEPGIELQFFRPFWKPEERLDYNDTSQGCWKRVGRDGTSGLRNWKKES